MNGRDPRDEFEARVRDSLQRDSEQIHPHGDGLARIRERTAGQRSTGRNWLMAGGIALATATAIAAAFFVSTDLLDQSSSPPPVASPTPDASPEPTTPAPSPNKSPAESPAESPSSTSPSATPPTPQPERLTVPAYFLGETTSGLRLFREFHRVDSSEPEAVTALNEMFAGARDPDYTSPWAAGSRALSVEAADGQITVDLSGEVRDTDVPPETAELMLQQLVYTVQAALQSTDPVQVLVEGEPVTELAGVSIDGPLQRADQLEVQALTWIISPSQGATVKPTFQVTGVAAAFEGTVQWRLTRGGDQVRGDFITIPGQRFSEYSFRIRGVAPGDYTLRVFQESAQDGSETFVDTKDITVR